MPRPASVSALSAKRAQTRARLIEVAATAIGELGLRAATMDEIARRAGMTKGAIYGNFDSKEDLFLAVVEAMPVGLGPVIKPGEPFKVQMRSLGRAVVAMAHSARPLAALAGELELYALTNEAMRARLASFYESRNKRTAAMLTQTINVKDLPLPADHFALMISALIGGLLHQRFVAPDLATDKRIIAAFEVLARR